MSHESGPVMGPFPSGSDFSITFQLLTNRQPTDLSGALVTASVHGSPDDAQSDTVTLISGRTLQSVESSAGKVRLSVTNALSRTWENGTYHGDVKAVLSDGKVRFWGFRVRVRESFE